LRLSRNGKAQPLSPRRPKPQLTPNRTQPNLDKPEVPPLPYALAAWDRQNPAGARREGVYTRGPPWEWL
jgi:hypothetical protein